LTTWRKGSQRACTAIEGWQVTECVEGEPTLGQLKSLAKEIHANIVNELDTQSISWISVIILLTIFMAACVYVVRLEYMYDNDKLNEDKEGLEKWYNGLEQRNDELMEEKRAEYNHLSKQLDKLREEKWELVRRYQDIRRLLVSCGVDVPPL
jgi:hypothetical protein